MIGTWSAQSPFMRAKGIPFVSVLPAITPATTPAAAGVVLTVSNGTWQFAKTFAYQWKVNGGNVGTNSNTFDTTGRASGEVISCQVTATSQSGSTAFGNSSNTVTMI